MHVEGARRILAGAGLDESALQTPPDVPLDDVERDAWLREGRGREPIAMNCSGKHAAMLATCVVNGWDVTTYRDPDHPLQRRHRRDLRRAHRRADRGRRGRRVRRAAVLGLAGRAGARLRGRWRPPPSGSAHLVAEAIRAHPEMVSGTRRDERTLLTAIPGAIGKAGAESCYAVALPDGRAFALKTDDGGQRARPVVMAAALRRSGVDVEPGVDTEAVRSTGVHDLLGGGEPVGVVRAVL